MKKSISIILVLIMLFSLTACSDSLNDNAQKDKNGRYLTIINETNQIINEIHVFVGEGTEIEDMKRENPDETSLSIKIPKQYKDYTEFTVVLVDRHGLKYGVVVSDVSEKGRTEVKITADDNIKSKGDFWKKVSKWFNGD